MVSKIQVGKGINERQSKAKKRKNKTTNETIKNEKHFDLFQVK